MVKQSGIAGDDLLTRLEAVELKFQENILAETLLRGLGGWGKKFLARLNLLSTNFSKKSREEIEKMFGFSELKQTKVYQEAKQEGKTERKLEAVPLMLNLGATVE
ncbi:hypothetical protein [Calothrix sp. CCY 0018]|uniref:hypothetical protein n=1 Tax=Calothrix sp. CCY 0018 TaxID=3103864 RepID=UPI0039C6EADC